eukprot:ctg_3144.g412
MPHPPVVAQCAGGTAAGHTRGRTGGGVRLSARVSTGGALATPDRHHRVARGGAAAAGVQRAGAARHPAAALPADAGAAAPLDLVQPRRLPAAARPGDAAAGRAATSGGAEAQRSERGVRRSECTRRDAWRINRPVLEVVERLWQRGGDIAGLVPRADLPPPPLEDIDDIVEEEAVEAGDATERVRRQRRAERRVRKTNRERHALRCDLMYKLQTAREFADVERFYLPHNLDFRGRAYPIPPLLNHMGSDVCRALLQFATPGRPLGERGIFWLKVHLANLCGRGKTSLSERVAFAESVMPQALAVARDPLSDAHLQWWATQEDPFQLLATCFEFAACNGGRDPHVVSTFPVHQDGCRAGEPGAERPTAGRVRGGGRSGARTHRRGGARRQSHRAAAGRAHQPQSGEADGDDLGVRGDLLRRARTDSEPVEGAAGHAAGASMGGESVRRAADAAVAGRPVPRRHRHHGVAGRVRCAHCLLALWRWRGALGHPARPAGGAAVPPARMPPGEHRGAESAAGRGQRGAAGEPCAPTQRLSAQLRALARLEPHADDRGGVSAAGHPVRRRARLVLDASVADGSPERHPPPSVRALAHARPAHGAVGALSAALSGHCVSGGAAPRPVGFAGGARLAVLFQLKGSARSVKRRVPSAAPVSSRLHQAHLVIARFGDVSHPRIRSVSLAAPHFQVAHLQPAHREVGDLELHLDGAFHRPLAPPGSVSPATAAHRVRART